MKLVYNEPGGVLLLVELVIGAKCSGSSRVCRVLKIINNSYNYYFPLNRGEIELDRAFLKEIPDPNDILKEIL